MFSKWLRGWLVLGMVLLGGCGGTVEFEAVEPFELERYLGTWHEIARLDHSFERGLTQVSATYSLRDDGGIRVINRGFDANQQRWKEAEGRAYFTGPSTQGRLKVSFFGPFFGGYTIVALDQADYRYAMVAGPNLKYLWILARETTLEPAIIDALLEQAGSLGFDTDALIFP